MGRLLKQVFSNIIIKLNINPRIKFVTFYFIEAKTAVRVNFLIICFCIVKISENIFKRRFLLWYNSLVFLFCMEFILCKIPNIFSKKTHGILLWRGKQWFLQKNVLFTKKNCSCPQTLFLYIDKFKRLILAKAVLANLETPRKDFLKNGLRHPL